MILGIIPARFASTRLMGKPLADIGGKPMLRHTWENAQKSKLLQDIVIAVDDEKVAQVARDFGAKVYITPKNVNTGTDRIAIVAKLIPEAHIIVNIQGDEPFIKGRMIDQAIEPLLFAPEVNVSTLAKKIETPEELKAISIPKVVFDYNNFAMYFSRSPIPFVRGARTSWNGCRSAISINISAYMSIQGNPPFLPSRSPGGGSRRAPALGARPMGVRVQMRLVWRVSPLRRARQWFD